VQTLENQPPSKGTAMAFSNMSQLALSNNKPSESLIWAKKAIEVANSVLDEEALCHALNNLGTIKTLKEETRLEGMGFLQQSLRIALNNHYQDQAGCAYVNLATTAVNLKMFSLAKNIIPKGISYCGNISLNSFADCLLAVQARLHLEIGDWEQAHLIAEDLTSKAGLKSEAGIQALILLATIRMRRGDPGILPALQTVKEQLKGLKEVKLSISLALAFLEYEWLSNTQYLQAEDMETLASAFADGARAGTFQWDEFMFWMQKARAQLVSPQEVHFAYCMIDQPSVQAAASFWLHCECPYMRALMLFEGDENEKRSAITIMDNLGAKGVADKLKGEMRAAGIKRIPRGIRKTTSSNKAYLTQREMEVLHLLQDGMQNKEIAEKLFVSPKTVDHHISAILLKLNVHSRVKAVQEALKRNIIFRKTFSAS
jgi:DNA-binding CsgD family transcriptional regulator